MVRRIEQKKRGRVSRTRKNIILIGTEGANKTETLYFSRFNRLNGSYIVRFAKGNDTDPVKIAKSVYKSIQDEALDIENGDLAFCVCDTDVDYAKEDALQRAMRFSKSKDIEMILSNPCFEVWFLLHFTFSTRCFNSNADVIAALRSYLPDYEKSRDIFEALLPRIERAKDNAVKLDRHHAEARHAPETLACNPSSIVYKIVEKLLQNHSKTELIG
jgi:hypothetical protein